MHRFDDRRCQRLGHIADAHLDHRRVRIGFAERVHSTRNLREQVAGLKFKVVVVDLCHLSFCNRCLSVKTSGINSSGLHYARPDPMSNARLSEGLARQVAFGPLVRGNHLSGSQGPFPIRTKSQGRAGHWAKSSTSLAIQYHRIANIKQVTKPLWIACMIMLG